MILPGKLSGARLHARQISVTAGDRPRLTTLASSRTAPYQQVIRARIVLQAECGCSNNAISRRLGVSVDTVRCWRGRYADQGLAGLTDRPRSGRPPRLSPLQVAEVKALACQLPAETGVPLSRWSCPELAGEVISRGIAPAISASTVRRILATDTLKPWHYQSWLFIRYPDFAAKAGRILGLYARLWHGVRLREDEYVISSDEKTSIQARCRCHPTLPPGASRAMRVEHEYDRGGALAYLAAYDVHRAHVIGLCADTTGIDPSTDLVDEVMTREPYTSAHRVFWVVDNGSSHRGQKAIDRLTRRYPNAVMVHTPVHASWLNQVEIVFSIVQRKVVAPNDFTDLDQVQERLAAFEHRYNQTARPFRWKFTTTDLQDLLTRIEQHEQTEPRPPNRAPASPADRGLNTRRTYEADH